MVLGLNLISFVCLFLVDVVHPLHISVTDITYDSKDQELEIMIRIFSEDLEQGIRKERKVPDLDIFDPGGDVSSKELIGAYVNGHFEVKLDGQMVKKKYLGYEEEGQAIICYIQIASVKRWKSIEVTNRILVDIFEDQSNLVHVTVGKAVKSVRLVRGKTTESISF